MSIDGALERGLHELSRFGLTPLQSKIYITLLMQGPSPARKIAKALAIHRVEIYRVMKTLKNMGLVEEILGNPRRYRAVEPERALETLVSQKMSRVKSLAKRAKEVGEWLTAVQGSGRIVEPEKDVSFVIVEGRRRVYDKVLDMITRAEEEVLAMMTANGLRRAVAMGMLDLIDGCVERGAKVRILSKIENENLREAEQLIRVCELRHDDRITSHIQIMDDKEVIIGALDTDDVHLSREEHIELWTNNKAYVCLMRESFEGRWRESTGARQRMRFLLTGTPIEETYFIKDNREARERLREKIVSAEREVFVLAPPAGLTSLLSDYDLKRIGGKGSVRYRCVSPITEGNLRVAEALSKELQLRHIESNDLEMFVIDGQHLFWSQFVSPQGRGEGDLGMLYSNERNYVGGMRALMERLWEGGVEAEVRIREVEVGSTIRAFNVVIGYDKIENCLSEMIAKAKTGLMIMLDRGSVPFLSRLDNGIDLAALKGRRVRVRCLLPSDTESLDSIGHLFGWFEFRRADEVSLCAVVAESEVAFHVSIPNTEPLQSVLWSDDKKIVSVIAGMVEAEWEKGLALEAGTKAQKGAGDRR